jgi:dipeptidyl aminopeptidase/acylaminoacyl peptidase
MARLAPARLLRWTDKQGRSFTGRFWSARRSGAGPAPLFITYYSCPGFVRGGVGDEWPLASLAQAGISALCINQPPGYIMDAVARHAQGMAAAESAVDLLSSRGEVDRARVGMGGLSFGGAVTMWTATDSDLLAAASVANPVVSPSYYLMASMKGEAFIKGLRDMWGLGSPSETPERWKAISPFYKLGRIHAPILFQHSEQEYMYALDYEIPLIREHRADLYVFPNEPHQKFQPRHKLAVYNRNLDWFRFWLQGYEDPDRAKAAQYARWRSMRSSLRKERAAR